MPPRQSEVPDEPAPRERLEVLRDSCPIPAGALGLTFLYAIADELYQTLVLTRVGSPWDVLIDTMGGAAALAGIRRAGRGKRRA
jgi:hypothetical protein